MNRITRELTEITLTRLKSASGKKFVIQNIAKNILKFVKIKQKISPN